MAAPEVTFYGGLRWWERHCVVIVSQMRRMGREYLPAAISPLFIWPFFTFHVGKQSIDSEHLGFRESDPKMA